MTINKDLFGAQDAAEKEEFNIEELVFSVQIALQKAMRRSGVSQADLAGKLGMSPARVSQIFSKGGPNLTLKTIAKIATALGEEFEIVTKAELNALKEQKAVRTVPVAVIWKPLQSSRNNPWAENSANSKFNIVEDLVA